MRLVVDTNVVISALLWGGTPKSVFALLETTAIEFYTSRALLGELTEALLRRKLAGTIAAIARAVPRDPDDDQVIACALAARAHLIVSGDTDLLVLGQCHGIRIVTPAVAVRLIGASSQGHRARRAGERHAEEGYRTDRSGALTLPAAAGLLSHPRPACCGDRLLRRAKSRGGSQREFNSNAAPCLNRQVAPGV